MSQTPIHAATVFESKPSRSAKKELAKMAKTIKQLKRRGMDFAVVVPVDPQVFQVLKETKDAKASESDVPEGPVPGTAKARHGHGGYL